MRWAIPILALCVALGGCTAMLLGGGSPSAGGSATHDGRSGSTIASDDRISAAVRTQLRAADTIGASRVVVATQAGKVTLRGEVGSVEARGQAEQLARSTTGVVDVKNLLVVASR